MGNGFELDGKTEKSVYFFVRFDSEEYFQRMTD